MNRTLKQRLLVTGEMAEKFFPQGFCREVLTLVDGIPPDEAAIMLDTYDFFLQTQRRYQEAAHRVYQELRAALAGEEPSELAWRLEFLVANASTPYDEAHLDPLRRAYASCRVKPSHVYSRDDFHGIMEGIGVLAFVMQDSPAYPSERALKFYSMVHAAGALTPFTPPRILKLLLPRVENLLEEHEALVSKGR